MQALRRWAPKGFSILNLAVISRHNLGPKTGFTFSKGFPVILPANKSQRNSEMAISKSLSGWVLSKLVIICLLIWFIVIVVVVPDVPYISKNIFHKKPVLLTLAFRK